MQIQWYFIFNGAHKPHLGIKTTANINQSTHTFFLKQGIFLKSFEELKFKLYIQMVWKNVLNWMINKVDYEISSCTVKWATLTFFSIHVHIHLTSVRLWYQKILVVPVYNVVLSVEIFSKICMDRTYVYCYASTFFSSNALPSFFLHLQKVLIFIGVIFL